jgi:hypothetical protein
MPRQKIDAVIEAVRYLPDGRIDSVRIYEKRGAIWSDHFLLDRTGLVERIKQGKKFVTGRRKTNFGSLLEIGQVVEYQQEFVATDGGKSGRDLLTGVPVY